MQAEHDAINIDAHEASVLLRGHRSKAELAHLRMWRRDLHTGIQMNACWYAMLRFVCFQVGNQGLPVLLAGNVAMEIGRPGLCRQGLTGLVIDVQGQHRAA